MNISPIRKTSLSLHEYARIVGLNPVHFCGAAGTTVWPISGSCSTIWTRYPWQNDDGNISWAELAEEIHNAEMDIAGYVGFPPAPTWINEEMHRYPLSVFLGANTGATNARNRLQGVSARYGKVISCGKRVTEEIDTAATVTYSDPDGDGYDERATITASTTLTSTEGIKVFFAGTLADPDWEVFPVNSISISGGTLTVIIDSWKLIDPDQHGATLFSEIDADNASSYVSTVDLYREYVDTTDNSVQFGWDGDNSQISSCIICSGLGCPSCLHTTQDGCTTIRDPNLGVVTPIPAAYSDGAWAVQSYSVGRDPDWLKLWYCAGAISDRYLGGLSFNPLSERMAQTIAMLTSARLSKPVCGCNNVEHVVKEWQNDLTQSTRDAFRVRFEGMDIFNCPFGTRNGEVRAWRNLLQDYGGGRWESGAF